MHPFNTSNELECDVAMPKTGLLPQVNRSPSFSTDTKLDWDIKFAVIKDTLQLLNIRYPLRLFNGLVTYPPPPQAHRQTPGP